MKKVFEYMGWSTDATFNREFYPNLDGNDMVEAIKKMTESRVWNDLEFDANNCYWQDKTTKCPFTSWLCGNPTNFFKLMEAWLDEKAD